MDKRRNAKRLLFSAIVVFWLVHFQAVAQHRPPDVPYDLHDGTPRLMGTEITYCLDDRKPDWELQRAVGEALAEALLLEPKFYVLSEQLSERLDQVLGMPDNLLFILLDDHCDAFLGVAFHPRSKIPEFVTLTNAYLSTGYVVASKDPQFAEFQAILDGANGSIKVGIPMASPMNGSVSITFPDTSRRVYRSESALLTGLSESEVGAGVFWEPGLHALSDWSLDESELVLGSAAPLPAAEGWNVGLSLMADRSYLRVLLSEAISVAISEGVIDDILAEFGLQDAVVTRPGAPR